MLRAKCHRAAEAAASGEECVQCPECVHVVGVARTLVEPAVHAAVPEKQRPGFARGVSSPVCHSAVDI